MAAGNMMGLGRISLNGLFWTEQNGHHLADDIFTTILLEEDWSILIEISLKFVHQSLIDNTSSLLRVMARCQSGDKPLPKPVAQFVDTYRLQQASLS